MIGLTIDRIEVGDSAQITRRVTHGDIAGFVDAVGDYNPVHSDREYAAATAFKEPIAPGIWTAGLISAVIGTRLPGPGAIYVSQELKFLKPVKSGDSISARVEVVEINREKNRIRLRTVCMNQRAEEVLTESDERMRHAHFSSDGRWIYVQASHRNIYRVPAEGGRLEQVTRFPEAGLFLEEPTISPDGRYLYYCRGNGGSSLWLMTLEGGDHDPL